jgi:hypothetical protein
VDEIYVVARQVLLDALDGLGSHREAVIVVGAHAVYMRVGEADLAVAPYTTDGDLAIDPATLGETPPLEQALTQAGFLPKATDSVGVWITHRPTAENPSTEVAIDLLVPASVSPGKGRRAARLPGHDSRAARIVRGLDGVTVDADTMSVAALESSDNRVFDMDDANARPVAEEAVDLLRQLFANRAGEGITMAIRAVGGLEDPEEIAASCELLANDLLREVTT